MENLINEIDLVKNYYNYKIPPIFINNQLSSKIRNDLTEIKLKEMVSLAEKIPIPALLGKYTSELHYLQTLELVLNSTAETRNRGMFFTKIILPLVTNKESLLDIGPGNGQLTCWIGNKFKQVTVVDTNAEALKKLNLEKKMLRNNIKLEKIHDSILYSKLPSNFYNLGLLSHVLYYLDSNQWITATKAVYKSIIKGGVIAIALSGGLNKADLIYRFGKKVLYIDNFIDECIEHFGSSNITIYISNEKFSTKSLTAMMHIAGFFLYDANITAKKEALLNYINKYFRKSTDYYEITSQQKFITIMKN